MARTLRAAVPSGVCFTRADLSFNARLAVFAEITDDLRNYLHSALASREAMSAVPENLPARLCENSRRSSADQVGKLCRFGFRPKRLRSAQGPLSSDEPMKAECKAKEQRI